MSVFLLLAFLASAFLSLPVEYHPPVTMFYDDGGCNNLVFMELYDNYYWRCLNTGLGTSYYLESNSTTTTEKYYDSCSNCICPETSTTYRPTVETCTAFGGGLWYERPGGMWSMSIPSSFHEIKMCVPTMSDCEADPAGGEWCRVLRAEPDTCFPNSDQGDYVMMSRNAGTRELEYIYDSDPSCTTGGAITKAFPEFECTYDGTWDSNVWADSGHDNPYGFTLMFLAPYAKLAATEAACLLDDTGDIFTLGSENRCFQYDTDVWVNRDSCSGDNIMTVRQYSDATCTTPTTSGLGVPLGSGGCLEVGPRRDMWMKASCDPAPAFNADEYETLTTSWASTGTGNVWTTYMRKNTCVRFPYTTYFNEYDSFLTARANCQTNGLSVDLYDQAACGGLARSNLMATQGQSISTGTPTGFYFINDQCVGGGPDPNGAAGVIVSFVLFVVAILVVF